MSLLFSEPTGSGITEPGAVLIQGDATAEDRIVTDMSSDPDLAALMETIAKRHPRGLFGVRRRAGECGGPTTCES